MNEWILTLTHKTSGSQRQFLFENEVAASTALAAAERSKPFIHKAGVTELDAKSYSEFTIGNAQASFDQLQWFTHWNMLAQTRGQHSVQALIAGEYAEKKAKEEAANPVPVPLSKVGGTH